MPDSAAAQKTELEAYKQRLRWRSRRGLLELDLFFEKFLENGFDALSAAELEIYEDLLMMPDNDLLDWVDGKVEPAEARYLPILARLRHWQIQGNE